MPLNRRIWLPVAVLVAAQALAVFAQETPTQTGAPAATQPKLTPPPATQPAAQNRGRAQPPKQAAGPAATRPAVPAAGVHPRTPVAPVEEAAPAQEHGGQQLDYWAMLFVFMMATFIGLGVILRVSRLLHTPLMSLTNAISAIAVVGSIIITGGEQYPGWCRVIGAVALFASMTNIVSGFLITDRMLKMFKTREVPKS